MSNVKPSFHGFEISKNLWITIFVLSIIVVVYSLALVISFYVLFIPVLLPEALTTSEIKTIIFSIHIFFGSIALLTGILNFNTRIMEPGEKIHKIFGRFYVVSIYFSGISGLVLATDSAGGIVGNFGFFSLGILWLTTTTIAFYKIIKFDIRAHRIWMIRSFALTLAAVTLRIWLPLLIVIVIIIGIEDPFLVVYPIISFLCWVPNIIIAEYLLRKK
jgi:hypothetical protein